MDMKGNFQDINMAAEKLSGYSKREVIGKNFQELGLIILKQIPGALKMLAESALGRATGPEELTLIRKNGTRAEIEIKSYPFTIDNKKLGVGIARDITKYKQTAEKLKWELAVNKALAELSNALIASEYSVEDISMIVLNYAKSLTGSKHGIVSTIDPDTGDNISHILTRMMKKCRLSGDNKRDVFPKSPDGLYPGLRGHSLNTLRAFYTNSPETHKSFKGIPKRHIAVKNFLSAPAVLNSELVGWIALANSENGYTDIHLEAVKRLASLFSMAVQRRRTEEMILQTRQDWENTFNMITDMITVHDKDFNIIRANKAAEKILNLPLLEATGTKCFKYYHGTDAPPEKCPSCQCLKTEKPAVFEMFEPYLHMFIEIRAIPQFDGNNHITGLIHVVRDITKRKETEYSLIQSRKELSIQAAELMEANAALKVLLKQRENDKVELEENISANFKTLVVPYMEKLKNANLKPESSEYISILESNLNKIISAFSQKLSSKYFGFTPKEIQVANLLKEGWQSKDIAEMFNLSFETVNCHRQNIRKKLGIQNKKTNLRSYLLSLSE
jgi:PAS domain S-box-containing protein